MTEVFAELSAIDKPVKEEDRVVYLLSWETKFLYYVTVLFNAGSTDTARHRRNFPPFPPS